MCIDFVVSIKIGFAALDFEGFKDTGAPDDRPLLFCGSTLIQPSRNREKERVLSSSLQTRSNFSPL
jgi:hypothetical protein